MAHLLDSHVDGITARNIIQEQGDETQQKVRRNSLSSVLFRAKYEFRMYIFLNFVPAFLFSEPQNGQLFGSPTLVLHSAGLSLFLQRGHSPENQSEGLKSCKVFMRLLRSGPRLRTNLTRFLSEEKSANNLLCSE